MNQGPICAKVYPQGIQPIKGNNCGLIPEGCFQRSGLIYSLCFLSIFEESQFKSVSFTFLTSVVKILIVTLFFLHKSVLPYFFFLP